VFKWLNTEDVLVVIGVASVVAGVYLVYPPAAYIVGGLFSLTGGVLLGRAKAKKVDNQ